MPEYWLLFIFTSGQESAVLSRSETSLRYRSDGLFLDSTPVFLAPRKRPDLLCWSGAGFRSYFGDDLAAQKQNKDCVVLE